MGNIVGRNFRTMGRPTQILRKTYRRINDRPDFDHGPVWPVDDRASIYIAERARIRWETGPIYDRRP